MPIFRVKSVKIYTGQKKFTRICSWDSWQISGMIKLNIKVSGYYFDLNDAAIAAWLLLLENLSRHGNNAFQIFFSFDSRGKKSTTNYTKWHQIAEIDLKLATFSQKIVCSERDACSSSSSSQRKYFFASWPVLRSFQLSEIEFDRQFWVAIKRVNWPRKSK